MAQGGFGIRWSRQRGQPSDNLIRLLGQGHVLDGIAPGFHALIDIVVIGRVAGISGRASEHVGKAIRLLRKELMKDVLSVMNGAQVRAPVGNVAEPVTLETSQAKGFDVATGSVRKARVHGRLMSRLKRSNAVDPFLRVGHVRLTQCFHQKME